MAETKENLLNYLKQLPSATLERLAQYAQLLIIPDEDLLVNATMSTMVDKAHALADIYFPQWTDRSKSDFGEFLVELIALFSEKDFWYINAIANENILSKTTTYSNAFAKALSLGYTPKVFHGANAPFSIQFSEGDTDTLVNIGELIVNVGELQFINTEAFTIPHSQVKSDLTMMLTEGKLYNQSVTFNGFNIVITRPHIDLSSVKVDGFTRVNNFANSDKDSTHYMVLPEENGTCSIFFGDGEFGVKPTLGTIMTISYRQCSGDNANINRTLASVSASNSFRPAISAIMLDNAKNGVSAESLESIRVNAPQNFTTSGTLSNLADIQAKINSIEGIAKSNVHINQRVISFQAIPLSGLYEPTQSERQNIFQTISPLLMLGYEFSYQRNSYVNILRKLDSENYRTIAVIVEAIISIGADSAMIENSIRNIVIDFTNPLTKANYGKGFSKQEIERYILINVEGVQSVTFKCSQNKIGDNLYRDIIMPDITLTPTEIFSKLDTNCLYINSYAV